MSTARRLRRKCSPSSSQAPDDHLNESKYVGVSLEGIYRVLSPYIHPIGLALYLEPTVGPGLRELESRLILQKNFLDDTLVIAVNLTVAQELRQLAGDPDAEAAKRRADTGIARRTCTSD